MNVGKGITTMGSLKNLFRKFGVALLAISLNNVALASNITYFHNDISGSPLAASDAMGNLLWKENYRPYGGKLNESTTSDNAIGYHGKPFDDATGLSYMGARYYDPFLGRFMGIDPIDFQESNIHSFNRYTYANNNPYKFVDPDGQFAMLIYPAMYLLSAVAAAVTVRSVMDRPTGQAGGFSHGGGSFNSGSDFGGESSWNNPYYSSENSKDTLKPGEHAGDSIDARGRERDFSSAERDEINNIGSDTGCHTCGTKDPGTKSNNFIPDHQPVSSLTPQGTPQKLYPHCLSCSRTQGGQANAAKNKSQ